MRSYRFVALSILSSIIVAGCASHSASVPSNLPPSQPGSTPGKFLNFYNVPGVGFSPVLGADGNVWFAGGAGIGKITPSGTITSYAVPNNDYPLFLATGPNATVWYTTCENSCASPIIGEVATATGAVTEYPLPARGSSFEIVEGSDGNMWFTENFG